MAEGFWDGRGNDSTSLRRTTLCRPPPTSVNPLQLSHPASQNIRRVPAQRLNQLKETATRLHIAHLMHHDDAEHPSSSLILLGRDFAQHGKQGKRIGLQLDAAQRLHQLRVGDHPPQLGPFDQDAAHFFFAGRPLFFGEAVFV